MPTQEKKKKQIHFRNANNNSVELSGLVAFGKRQDFLKVFPNEYVSVTEDLVGGFSEHLSKFGHWVKAVK
jgi:hypothetical protein